jgi:hypothetical protein
MAYFIFLKSLRSLEEFRKNLHVKIPPKSPCANFQSHGILKIKFYSEKKFFSCHIRPIHPFGPAAAHSFFSFQPAAPLLPTRPRPLSRPARRWRPAELPPPHRKTPPATPLSPCLRARLTDGPHLSSLTSGTPELGRATTTSRRSPHRPALPQMPPELLPPRHHFPSLIPPLNLAPAFNGVNAINAAVTPLATSLRRSTGPYKRAMRSPTLTAPHPLSPKLFRALLRPHDGLKPSLFVASGARPLRHPSVAGEHLPSTASTGSSSPSIADEHRRAPAPVHRTPRKPPPRPLSAVHRGLAMSVVHRTVDSVHGIFR